MYTESDNDIDVVITDNFFNLTELHSNLLEFIDDAYEQENAVFMPFLPALISIACEQGVYMQVMMNGAQVNASIIPETEEKFAIADAQSRIACFHEGPTFEQTLKFATLNARLIACIDTIITGGADAGPHLISLLETAYFQAEFVMKKLGIVLAAEQVREEEKLLALDEELVRQVQATGLGSTTQETGEDGTETRLPGHTDTYPAGDGPVPGADSLYS